MVPLLQSSSQAVLAGNTTSDYQFGVNSRGGYQTIVNLTCQGLPAQASCVFGANPLVLPAGGGTGTSLKVTTTTGLAIGDYNFNVVAADASITQTIPAVMHVGDFTLDLASDGTPIPLPSGDTGFALTIGSVNQFGGNVTLALTGLPAGTTHGLTPVSSPGLVQRFGVLTSNVPAGNYPFVITGTNGVVSKTVAGTLRVGDFNSAGITPSTATLNVGQSANFTVKLNSVNGFAGPLGLVCSPTINGQSVAGVQCLFTPQPATFDASGTLAAQMAVTVVSRPKSQTVPRRAAATKPPGDFRLLFVFAIVLPAGLLMSRSNRRRAGVAFFGTVALFLLVSCGGGGGSSGGPPPPPPPPPPPQNVVITINAQGQAYTKTVGSVTVTVP
jgi:hypothetical protein